jgi:hypothetical protein
LSGEQARTDDGRPFLNIRLALTLADFGGRVNQVNPVNVVGNVVAVPRLPHTLETLGVLVMIRLPAVVPLRVLAVQVGLFDRADRQIGEAMTALMDMAKYRRPKGMSTDFQMEHHIPAVIHEANLTREGRHEVKVAVEGQVITRFPIHVTTSR